MVRHLTLAAAAALGFVSLQANTAHATVAVTLDPNAVGLGAAPNTFTADSLILADYAQVTLGATTNGQTAFTETGYLSVSGFSLNGQTISPPGLNSAGSGAYSLYFNFTASGFQSASSTSTSAIGSLSTLSFTLYGGNGIATFSPTSETGTTNNVTLASGGLLDAGDTFVDFVNNGAGVSTSAQNITTDFIGDPGATGFVVSPANAVLDLTSAFTNNTGTVQVISSTEFVISGGSGDASFQSVPEPASLALLGAGLFGAGLVRRRRA